MIDADGSTYHDGFYCVGAGPYEIDVYDEREEKELDHEMFQR